MGKKQKESKRYKVTCSDPSIKTFIQLWEKIVGLLPKVKVQKDGCAPEGIMLDKLCSAFCFIELTKAQAEKLTKGNFCLELTKD